MSWSMHCVRRHRTTLPETLTQRFTVETRVNGQWQTHLVETNNIHRYRRLHVDTLCEAVHLRIDRFHGSIDRARVYTFLVR